MAYGDMPIGRGHAAQRRRNAEEERKKRPFTGDASGSSRDARWGHRPYRVPGPRRRAPILLLPVEMQLVVFEFAGLRALVACASLTRSIRATLSGTPPLWAAFSGAILDLGRRKHQERAGRVRSKRASEAAEERRR